jgi:fumarate reductase flavoprotein subunit
VSAQAVEEERRLEGLLGRPGGRERVATLRGEMQKTMERSAGIYRSQAGLEEGVAALARLAERYRDLALDDRSRTFNTELIGALELGYMLDLARAILAAALWRKESRGSHQRTDHPRRDDERYLGHSLASRGADGAPRIEHKAVTITRWPPGERVYGR